MKTISLINASLTNLVYAAILAGLVLAFVDTAPRTGKHGSASAPRMAELTRILRTA